MIEFDAFLEGLKKRSWLQAFSWQKISAEMSPADILPPSQVTPHYSRSHKRDETKTTWCIEIRSIAESYSVGVDLEYFHERPILAPHRLSWLLSRLGMKSTANAEEALMEWCCREAAYKAIARAYPQAMPAVVSEIRRISEKRWRLDRKGLPDVEIEWDRQGPWILAVARIQADLHHF